MNNCDRTILREISFSILSEGKSIKLRAEGYSMYPAIKPGSTIHIEPYPEGNEPSEGDIIACGSESGMVVHRLIRKAKDEGGTYYVTRGDSNLSEDHPVTPDRVAGKVVMIEYRGKEKRVRREKPSRFKYRVNRMMVWLILNIKKIKDKSKKLCQP